jgi:hypothetical protein
MNTPDEPTSDDSSGTDSKGQVSEISSFDEPGEPISPGDSVAGAPTGESGRADEGPTGPDAVTNASHQDRYPDKDDAETTG